MTSPKYPNYEFALDDKLCIESLLKYKINIKFHMSS